MYSSGVHLVWRNHYKAVVLLQLIQCLMLLPLFVCFFSCFVVQCLVFFLVL